MAKAWICNECDTKNSWGMSFCGNCESHRYYNDESSRVSRVDVLSVPKSVQVGQLRSSGFSDRYIEEALSIKL